MSSSSVHQQSCVVAICRGETVEFLLTYITHSAVEEAPREPYKTTSFAVYQADGTSLVQHTMLSVQGLLSA